MYVTDEIPRLSFHTIRWKAEELLEQLQPDALRRPEPIDCVHLVETYLPMIGVHVEVGDVDELGEVEAYTEFSLNGIDLVIRSDQMVDLYDNIPRPKASVAHETGHIVLHRKMAMGRCGRSHDGGFDRLGNAEWQAWAFAGCLLMPVEMVQGLVEIDEVAVGHVFDVSPQIAWWHLRRMQRSNLL